MEISPLNLHHERVNQAQRFEKCPEQLLFRDNTFEENSHKLYLNRQNNTLLIRF